MSRVLPLLRAVLVWTAVTALSALMLGCAADAAAPTLRQVGAGAVPLLDRSFEQLLTAAAATGLATAATWLWAATTAVVVRVLVLAPTAAGRPVGGVPRPVQRLVLAACGVALAGGLALPAQAEPGTLGVGSPAPTAPVPGALAGLPLPERATAGEVVHVVRAGDSLWAIAASRLPAGATDAEITAAWQAVHRANRAVVGPDPDLVHPAQRLRVPGL